MVRTEQLRAFLLEYLKEAVNRQEQLQYGNCLSNIRAKANQQYPSQYRDDEDGARLKHVIWDLILERVLTPGTNSPNSLNDGWPFLSITDHGRKVIAEQKPVPYDPDGYIARLTQCTNGLHPTVEAYLAEALSTFRTGNNMAAAVMLGAASEMVFVEICQAIGGAIANPAERSDFEKKSDSKKKMVERVKAVADWLAQKKSQLPRDWQNAERHQLIQKIADLIRNRRNDTGHPQDPPKKPSHEEMYALLMIFSDYCDKLYGLKTWLQANKASIT